MSWCLFFDELYASHAFYRWDEVERWLEEADVVVFCGTSFAPIGVTEDGLIGAGTRGVPIFNINLEVADRLEPPQRAKGTNNKRKRKRAKKQRDDVWPGAGNEPFLEDIIHILGKSETILPLLADACSSKNNNAQATQEKVEKATTAASEERKEG